MDSISRRSFLKTSVVTAGALGVAGKLPAMAQDAPADKPPLITRTLGRTGLTIPIVSFGVMRADNPALVRAALEDGVVLFDTAHSYQKGKNEEMLGEVLKDRPRSSFVIATKVGPTATKEEFLEKVTLSLQRLQMQQVDILYLHGPSDRESVLNPVMLEALKEAKASGKTRFLGVSTHKNEPEVIRAAVESKVLDVVLTSLNYQQDHAEELRKAIDEAAAAGVGIVAMKTMAGGFLDKDRKKPVSCRAALKWALQNPHVTTSIPGVMTFDQLEDNLAVNRDLVLTQEEKDALAMGKAQGSLYCNACEHCVPDCPKALPIPELMRAYMYTYGYGSPRQGRELIATLGLPSHPCGGCAGCSAECVKGFDLKERISDVARLRDVPEEFLA